MKTYSALAIVILFLAAGLAALAVLSANKTRENQRLLAQKAALESKAASLSSRVEQLKTDLDAARAEAVPRWSKRSIPDGPVATAGGQDPRAPRAATVAMGSGEGISAQQLAAKEQEIAELRAQLAQAQARPAPADARASFAERMRGASEKLRQENPQEYARIEDERRQRRQEMANMTSDRLEFLKSLPTEGLSDEYLQNHQAVIERLTLFDQAMAAISANPDSEQSRTLRRQLFENSRGMGEMMQKERTVLLNDLAYEIGYRGPQAQQLVDYVNYVQEATSAPHPHGFGRGGGRPQGGGGGAPAPGAQGAAPAR